MVKWGRWFLQIVDIHVGNFNMKLTGRWFPQIVDYKGQWESISNIYITKIVVFVSEPVRGRSRATELPCYAIFNIKKIYWKVPLHLLVKWEVVSPNSREGQLASISIISSIPLFWFCISNVGVVWGGGDVMFFSHFMLFPTFLEKQIWEYKIIISHLMFCMLEIL